jgi:hypothetical protein
MRQPAAELVDVDAAVLVLVEAPEDHADLYEGRAGITPHSCSFVWRIPNATENGSAEWRTALDRARVLVLLLALLTWVRPRR